MKQIDPVERALDAYGELDTDQKLVFSAAIKHIERAIELWSRGDDKPAPKIGRPKGSKNRERNVQVAEPFRGILNAASEEGL